MAGDHLLFTGVVKEAGRNAVFVVQVQEIASPVTCTLGGKIKQNNIKILSGDRVDIQVDIYNTSKGRIVYRHK